MPRTRPPYPQKFREQIVELARNGRSPKELAEEFEPTETTIRNWLQQAAEHATQVEDALMSEYEIERGQLDALWSYVGHKGQDGEQESEEGEKRSP